MAEIGQITDLDVLFAVSSYEYISSETYRSPLLQIPMAPTSIPKTFTKKLSFRIKPYIAVNLFANTNTIITMIGGGLS